MLTMAIGAGTLVFRVMTLHPRTNSVDLDSLQKRLRAAEIPSLHSVLVIQHDQMIVEWYFEGADEDRGRDGSAPSSSAQRRSMTCGQ